MRDTSSFVRQLEQLDGATDEEGRLLAGLGPAALGLEPSQIEPPPFLGVKDGLLLWSAYHPEGPYGLSDMVERIAKPRGRADVRGLLLKFARVVDRRSAERVASRYGPLGLCEHDYLRAKGSRWLLQLLSGREPQPQPREGRGWFCCSKPHLVHLPYGGWAVGESLEGWLAHARWLRYLLEALSWLRQGKVPPERVWWEATAGPLSPRWPGLRRRRTPGYPSARPEDLLLALEWTAAAWIRPLLDLEPQVTTEGLRVRLRTCFLSLADALEEGAELLGEADFSDICFAVQAVGEEGWLEVAGLAGLGVGFAPFVALQLAGLVWGRVADVALCAGCQEPFLPTRKPRRGVRHFCKRCRGSPLPAKLRKRDERARKRHRDEVSHGEAQG